MLRNVECVNVDILKNQDVLNDDVWSYLMMLVRTGRVMAILAGPPCRTVSVAPYKQDNGPKLLRSRTGYEMGHKYSLQAEVGEYGQSAMASNTLHALGGETSTTRRSRP